VYYAGCRSSPCASEGSSWRAPLGAVVARQAQPEVGVHDVYLTDAARRDPLFSGLPGRLEVLGWHQDRFELPPGAIPLAGSIPCTYQLEAADVTPDDLAAELVRAAPELDRLAHQLLERWLSLASHVAARDERRLGVAV
jgi:hypothetical protein